MADLPIKKINKANQQSKDEIEKLVDQLIRLLQHNPATKTSTNYNQFQTKIDYCEERINQLVYQLYELTVDEIKIVEGK